MANGTENVPFTENKEEGKGISTDNLYRESSVLWHLHPKLDSSTEFKILSDLTLKSKHDVSSAPTFQQLLD